MKFVNNGLDRPITLTVLKHHQVSALVAGDIKCSQLPNLLKLESGIPVTDIIDIAVTYYAAAIKLSLLDVRSFMTYASDEIKVLVDKELTRVSRFDVLKDFNRYKEFYVCKHREGCVMAITSPGSPPPARFKDGGEWVHVVEEGFGTALLRSIYHLYGYHNVHFKPLVDELPDEGFTLANVFRCIG